MLKDITNCPFFCCSRRYHIHLDDPENEVLLTSLEQMTSEAATKYLSTEHKSNQSSTNSLGSRLRPSPLSQEREERQILENTLVKSVLKKSIANRLGTKSRNQNVTTEQIYTKLLNHFNLGKDELLNLSRVLARQINLIKENPLEYFGKNLQLKPQDRTYPFCFHEKTKQELILNYFCWFELSVDGSEIEILIVPKYKKFGEGTSKQAISAITIFVPFSIEDRPKILASEAGKVLIYQRDIKCAPKVLLKPQKDRFDDSLETIEKERKLLKFLKKQLPHTELVSLIKKTKPLVQGTHGEILFSQDSYDSDMGKIYDNGGISIDANDQTKMREVSVVEIFKIVHEVAITLKDLHNIHYVHNDIKPKNLFIKMSRDQKTLKGFLADYDMTQLMGIRSFRCHEHYPFWDTLANRELVTPFTDIYGLTMTLALCILPGFDKLSELHLKNKTEREKYLLKTFKTLCPHVTPPKNFNQTSDLLKWYEFNLNGFGGTNPYIINKLRAIQKTLELVVEVLKIDENLSKKFPAIQFPVLKFIRENSFFTSEQINNSILNIEIETFINIQGSVFNSLISSQIPEWGKLSPAEKISKAKNLFSSITSIDDLTKTNIEKNIKKIESRLAALEFLSKLNFKEIDKHPLFHALYKPTILIDEELTFKYFNEEIEKTIEKDNQLFEFFCKNFKSTDDPKQRRLHFKNEIYNLINNPKVVKNLKDKASNLLTEIIKIEKAMNFAIEMRNHYMEVVDQVMTMVMTIDTFLSRINDITEAFVQLEELEEKK